MRGIGQSHIKPKSYNHFGLAEPKFDQIMLKTIRSTQEKGFHLTRPKGFAATGSVPGVAIARFVTPSFAKLRTDTNRGFTLLELMIVIGLLAILAVIALPSYSEYVVRTKLRSGTEGLSSFRSVLEQAYQDTRSYRDDADSACRIATYPTDNFSLTCAATSDVLFTLTASSLADVGLGNAGSYVFTINQDGATKTTKFKGGSVNLDYWKYRD